MPPGLDIFLFVTEGEMLVWSRGLCVCVLYSNKAAILGQGWYSDREGPWDDMKVITDAGPISEAGMAWSFFTR